MTIISDDLFNTTCTIYTRTEAQDSTSHEMVETWATYASAVPCRLDVARGGVQVSGDNFLSKRTHVIYMDYRADISWKDKRIKIGTETFDVLLVANAGGESDHLEISVEIVA